MNSRLFFLMLFTQQAGHRLQHTDRPTFFPPRMVRTRGYRLSTVFAAQLEIEKIRPVPDILAHKRGDKLKKKARSQVRSHIKTNTVPTVIRVLKEQCRSDTHSSEGIAVHQPTAHMVIAVQENWGGDTRWCASSRVDPKALKLMIAGRSRWEQISKKFKAAFEVKKTTVKWLQQGDTPDCKMVCKETHMEIWEILNSYFHLQFHATQYLMGHCRELAMGVAHLISKDPFWVRMRMRILVLSLESRNPGGARHSVVLIADPEVNVIKGSIFLDLIGANMIMVDPWQQHLRSDGKIHPLIVTNNDTPASSFREALKNVIATLVLQGNLPPEEAENLVFFYETIVRDVQKKSSSEQLLANKDDDCECHNDRGLKAALQRAEKASKLGQSGELFLAIEASSSANLSP